MEFVVSSGDLLQELALMQGIVERKTTIPILSNVRIEAREQKKGGEIEIVATDLDVGVRSVFDGVVKKPGEMTLPARRLHDIARLLPDSEVEFKAREGSWVNITCERTRYRLAGAGVDDYPSLPDCDFKSAVTLPLEPLKSMIERVIFAISTEDPRYAMQGGLLKISGGKVTLVATDGHRLSIVTRTGDVGKSPDIEVVIPKKTLQELQKVEPGPEGEVRFAQKGTQMFFRVGRRLLWSNTPEGNFPAWEKVLPKDNKNEATVASEDLRTALNRVVLLSQERSKLVKFNFEDGKITLSTKNPEMGEAEEVLSAEYSGEPMQIGFNGRYLSEFLQAAGADRIRLHLENENAPGMVTPDGEQEWDYRYVIMPMRLS